MDQMSESTMDHSKLDAIMSVLTTMNIDRERLVKQTKELNSRLCKLETKLQQPMEHVHTPTIPTIIASSSSKSNKELGVSLPNKFDGMCSKFQGFISQIQLVTLLQLQQYPTNVAYVGLVGTLLLRQMLS